MSATLDFVALCAALCIATYGFQSRSPLPTASDITALRPAISSSRNSYCCCPLRLAVTQLGGARALLSLFAHSLVTVLPTRILGDVLDGFYTSMHWRFLVAPSTLHLHMDSAWSAM